MEPQFVCRLQVVHYIMFAAVVSSQFWECSVRCLLEKTVFVWILRSHVDTILVRHQKFLMDCLMIRSNHHHFSSATLVDPHGAVCSWVPVVQLITGPSKLANSSPSSSGPKRWEERMFTWGWGFPLHKPHPYS